ncbi:Multidrug resistance protein MdtC [Enhygromyxa salina]|uniref:Multidrug resistance protein MdtC n=1 Tax=Enhygromyxa salina TaxID=215803 RepID=A0A2S9YHH7_9BACT|nr:efflux RND transporter permease subunit [Enhygromyxa salina]PRQ04491.1 Multidrug resistance protein MdtC [Enhygromyxa salina]
MRSWSLSDLALARPVTVAMLLVAVFLLGTIAMVKLPLAFLPAEAVSRVQIRVNITTTSPEILEREVIRPLEDAVAGVGDLDTMSVSSGSWGVRMRLQFRPGTDIDARKLELRERVDRARGLLPDSVQTVELSSSQGAADEPIMRVRIASDKQLDGEYYLIERRVVRAIERIEGVASVELEGVEPHELEVALDLDAARSHGIALADVGGAVRQSQRGRSLGTLRRTSRDTGLRSPGAPAEAEHFAALPVERGAASAGQSEDEADALTLSGGTDEGAGSSAGSTTIAGSGSAARDRSFARLGEVAGIAMHPKEQRRGSRLNGRPAINLEVFAEAGASPVDVSTAVREVVDGLRGDPALGGIDVAVFEDQGTVILSTLGDLRDTGLYGGLIGVIVLFGFLHRWRTTLTAAVCIPLSVLAACGVLFLRGSELNCIVLLGLVLCVGMLIDNAVVIVESIQLHLQRGESRLEAARQGAREVGLATVASTMSSVIVFLPMIVGGGGGGEMYTYMRPLGATFVTALVASLLVSQLAVPLLMALRAPARWRRTKPRGADDESSYRQTRNVVLEPIARLYARFVSWTIAHPRLTLLVGLGLCVTAVYPAMNMQVDMGTDEKMVAMPIRLELTGSRDVEEVEARVVVAERALLGAKDEIGIETLTCRYRDWGAWCDAFPGTDIQSEQQMSDFKQRIADALPEQPGVRYHVGERDGWWMRNRDPREVQFVLRGEDMSTLFEQSERFANHLAARLPKGSADNPDAGGYDTITGPFNEGNQELHVVLDIDRLRRLGLRASDVAQMVSLAFEGVPLGSIRGPQGEVSLRLSTGRLSEGRRGAGSDAGSDPGSDDGADDGPGLAELEDLRIPLPEATPDGAREVSLASLGTIELARSPWWVQRVDRQTELRMKVRFVSPDQEANNAALEQAKQGFVLPEGYSFGERTRWGRDEGEMIDLIVNLGLCLILVYAVMASLFESFLQPGAILTTGLLGCFGAPWAMWATKTTFDVVAMIGLFILIGIIVNNGIMLVDKVTQLRAHGVSRDEALARAGRDRLRPVLMTAFTTIFGLIPMLLHHPTLAGVYYHSIAIIIAAGLATSTVMTLVFLPSAYVLVENFSLTSRRVWAKIVGAGALRRG